MSNANCVQHFWITTHCLVAKWPPTTNENIEQCCVSKYKMMVRDIWWTNCFQRYFTPTVCWLIVTSCLPPGYCRPPPLPDMLPLPLLPTWRVRPWWPMYTSRTFSTSLNPAARSCGSGGRSSAVWWIDMISRSPCFLNGRTLHLKTLPLLAAAILC